jgi:predicted nucleic acid-binding protein
VQRGSVFWRICSAECLFYPVTTPVALRAGPIDGLLQSQGKRVALADLLIGSTALELGYAVATHNARHFAMIPDLTVKPL